MLYNLQLSQYFVDILSRHDNGSIVQRINSWALSNYCLWLEWTFRSM